MTDNVGIDGKARFAVLLVGEAPKLIQQDAPGVGVMSDMLNNLITTHSATIKVNEANEVTVSENVQMTFGDGEPAAQAGEVSRVAIVHDEDFSQLTLAKAIEAVFPEAEEGCISLVLGSTKFKGMLLRSFTSFANSKEDHFDPSILRHGVMPLDVVPDFKTIFLPPTPTSSAGATTQDEETPQNRGTKPVSTGQSPVLDLPLPNDATGVHEEQVELIEEVMSDDEASRLIKSNNARWTKVRVLAGRGLVNFVLIYDGVKGSVPPRLMNQIRTIQEARLICIKMGIEPIVKATVVIVKEGVKHAVQAQGIYCFANEKVLKDVSIPQGVAKFIWELDRHNMKLWEAFDDQIITMQKSMQMVANASENFSSNDVSPEKEEEIRKNSLEFRNGFADRTPGALAFGQSPLSPRPGGSSTLPGGPVSRLGSIMPFTGSKPESRSKSQSIAELLEALPEGGGTVPDRIKVSSTHMGGPGMFSPRCVICLLVGQYLGMPHKHDPALTMQHLAFFEMPKKHQEVAAAKVKDFMGNVAFIRDNVKDLFYGSMTETEIREKSWQLSSVRPREAALVELFKNHCYAVCRTVKTLTTAENIEKMDAGELTSETVGGYFASKFAVVKAGSSDAETKAEERQEEKEQAALRSFAGGTSARSVAPPATSPTDLSEIKAMLLAQGKKAAEEKKRGDKRNRDDREPKPRTPGTCFYCWKKKGYPVKHKAPECTNCPADEKQSNIEKSRD